MKDLQKEVKELKKQVTKLQSICNKLISKLEDRPINRRKTKVDVYKDLYYSDEMYTQKEIAEIMGVSTKSVTRYKKKLN